MNGIEDVNSTVSNCLCGEIGRSSFENKQKIRLSGKTRQRHRNSIEDVEVIYLSTQTFKYHFTG